MPGVGGVVDPVGLGVGLPVGDLVDEGVGSGWLGVGLGVDGEGFGWDGEGFGEGEGDDWVGEGLGLAVETGVSVTVGEADAAVGLWLWLGELLWLDELAPLEPVGAVHAVRRIWDLPPRRTCWAPLAARLADVIWTELLLVEQGFVA